MKQYNNHNILHEKIHSIKQKHIPNLLQPNSTNLIDKISQMSKNQKEKILNSNNQKSIKKLKQINIKFDDKQNKDILKNFSIRRLNKIQNKYYNEYLQLKEQNNKKIHPRVNTVFFVKALDLKQKIMHCNKTKNNTCQKYKSNNNNNSNHNKNKILEQNKKLSSKYIQDENKLLKNKQIQNSFQSTLQNLSNNNNRIKNLSGNNKERKLFTQGQSIQQNNEIWKGIRKNSKKLCLKQSSNDKLWARNQIKFQDKLKDYHQLLKDSCQLHGFQLKKNNGDISVYIGKGNNSKLIRQLLRKRWWLTISQDRNKNNHNFIWTQLKERQFYQQIDNNNNTNTTNNNNNITTNTNNNIEKQQNIENNNNIKEIQKERNKQKQQKIYLHNHFEQNQFLGNKKALFYSMLNYYNQMNQNVFNYLPLTYHITSLEDQSWLNFTKYQQQQNNNNNYHSNNNNQIKNLWIVKPGQNSNRGKGITIHQSNSSIKQLIKNQIQICHKKTFIIQKYIEKPFLYNRRKFDIRCFMLLVRLKDTIKGYWYQQGYIRTSCYQYKLNDYQNQFIHLTNDAIQINCNKYGKFQDGNKLNYFTFQKYLDINYPNNKYNFRIEVYPKLKQIAIHTIKATHQLIGNYKLEKPTFQLFGLDFMIDDNFKPWLIEVNTNPCLETNSSILDRIIPRMIDTTLKLTLDCLFPPPENWSNSKKYLLSNTINNNLFQLIFDSSNKSNSITTNHKIINNFEKIGDIQEDNQTYQEQQINKIKDKIIYSNNSTHK